MAREIERKFLVPDTAFLRGLKAPGTGPGSEAGRSGASHPAQATLH